MSYADGLQFWPSAATAAEVETGAADLYDLDVAFPVQIEGFGLVMTETNGTQATDAVVSLDISTNSGESDRAEKATITIPDAAAAGAVLVSTDADFPIKLPAGSRATIEYKTAATGAPGAFKPYLLLRCEGIDLESSLVTKIAT